MAIYGVLSTMHAWYHTSALVVGGTDTSSRHWSPASPLPVPHSSEPRPGSLEVPGMGLCLTFYVERQLDLSSVAARLRGGPVLVVRFPTEPVTREAHPLPPQVRARRTFLDRRPVPGRVVAVQEISEMADRRVWGGGGDDPEESTQRMIERIWESLTDIRARMDQQAPVPPVAVPPGEGEAVPVAPVPPRVEVPFVAPVPPPPPVQLVEEPVPRSSWTIVGRAALPDCARKRRGVVQFAWELAEGTA
ncbi:hypothetical protein Taro_021579 [Colocasia esculenta]|uniref:Uncharacterized protein n=1 Tax=Colocasia esculenta TaxID=4460 RepID=A0A843UZD4_COLES|nr:hypothetical protein [Colocasia esculenta]